MSLPHLLEWEHMHIGSNGTQKDDFQLQGNCILKEEFESIGAG